MKLPPESASFPPAPLNGGLATDAISAMEEHEPALRQLVASKLSGCGESAIDDVLQEVALSAQGSEVMAKVEPSKIKSWLKQVAIHKVQDYWRGVGRQRQLHDRLSDMSDTNRSDSVSPFEWVARAEECKSVSDALQLLSEEDRKILELKYYKNLNYQETAQEVGLSIKTLEYRLSRARKSLRRLLRVQADENRNPNLS